VSKKTPQSPGLKIALKPKAGKISLRAGAGRSKNMIVICHLGLLGIQMLTLLLREEIPD
jgi:hypothetical protein